ncbi:MAG: hypothetical protein HQK91_06230 [Nitrospirae bacterium]|nr:hypothetical protein [Nitrospirota bacterium]
MADLDNYESEIERLKSLISGEGTSSVTSFSPEPKKSQEPPTPSKASVSTHATDTSQSKQSEGSNAEQAEGKKIPNVTTGPVGLDIGTSHVVSAFKKGESLKTFKQLNAFFTIPASNFTKDILAQNNIMFFEFDKKFYISGYAADGFANMFNTNTRRSIDKGILSPRESEGIQVIKAVVSSIVSKPTKFGETICFSVPGQPVDSNISIVYHESVIKRFLSTLGYVPISINEGLAVVMSELKNENYTGIGISFGGGMCNVCLAYYSVPVITFSIQKGGDYIDAMAGASIGESATKMKGIKEAGLDFTSKDVSDRAIIALQIFYDDLIITLLKAMRDVFSSSERIPKLERPIPIILSGGTSLPNGFRDRFQKAMKSVKLPLEISYINVAEEPLTSIAKGAYLMAQTESV